MSFTGFTLNELIIGMAVAAILVSLAVPSLQSYVINTKLSASTNALIGSLNFARSEAIKRGVPVSICPSTNGSICTVTPWGRGWIVFVDEGTPGLIDGDDEVLVGGSGFDEDPEFSLGGPNFIQFQPNGGLMGDCADECAAPSAPWHPAPGSLLSLASLFRLLSPVSDAHAAKDDATPADAALMQEALVGDGPSSLSAGPGPAPSSATFEACRNGVGRAISVSPLGRISVTDINCPQ